MRLNYQIATFEEVRERIDSVIRAAASSLSDSPKSKAFQVNNHIGFFQGVCAARGFKYSLDLISDWQVLGNS